MIQSNELRIGNLINNKGNEGYSNPGVTEVDSISSSGINEWSDMGSSGEIPFEDCDGIPLTEEWLTKLGFTQTITNYYWRTFFTPDQFSCSIAMRDKDPGGLNKGQMIAGSKNVPVRFVHDLQNVYWSSAGKELKIIE